MKELRKIKIFVLVAFAAIGIMTSKSPVNAEMPSSFYETPYDMEINKECGFEIRIKTNNNYVVKFNPDKTGVYNFNYYLSCVEKQDDKNYISLYYYNGNHNSIRYGSLDVDSEYKDCMYCVAGHTYYVEYCKYNTSNIFNIDCAVSYGGNIKIEPELKCSEYYDGPLIDLNQRKGVKFDKNSRTLELNNYSGDGFYFCVDLKQNYLICDINEVLPKDYGITIILKGKNIIKAWKDSANIIGADEGISLKIIGDGSLEWEDTTDIKKEQWYYPSDYYASIVSGKNLTIDGVKINSIGITAPGEIYIKSSDLHLSDMVKSGKELSISNSKVVVENTLEDGSAYTLDSTNIQITGSDIYLKSNRASALIYSYETCMLKDSNIHLISEAFIPYGTTNSRDLISTNNIDISNCDFVVEYLDDNKVNNSTEYMLHNLIFSAYGKFIIKNINLIIVANDSIINAIVDEKDDADNKFEYVIFEKTYYQDVYDVNMSTVKIIKTSSYDIKGYNFKLKNDSYNYNGKEIKPEVDLNGLMEGMDVDIKYENNIDPGKGRVVITGKGKYTGKVVFDFVIKGTKPSAGGKASNNVAKKGTIISDGKYKYKVLKTGSLDGKSIGKVSVIGFKKKSLKKVSIKSKLTINGVKYKVTAIAKKAFKNNKKIKTVVIGKNVKKIGKGAFAGCKNLKYIKVKSKNIKKLLKKSGYKGVIK